MLVDDKQLFIELDKPVSLKELSDNLMFFDTLYIQQLLFEKLQLLRNCLFFLFGFGTGFTSCFGVLYGGFSSAIICGSVFFSNFGSYGLLFSLAA